MTLTEFLLEQFAEEESLWEMAHANGLVMTVEGASAIPPSSFAPRMAEAARAKRRIVKDYLEFDNAAGRDAGEFFGLEIAVQHLLLPYADHPDYDEGWRL